MELNQNQWHVKFYFWCLDIWDAFMDTHTDRRKSNLCQYIRTIFVWMPLALVVNLGFWLYFLYILLYFPLTHFGVAGSAAGYLMVGLAGGSIWLYYFVKKKLTERRRAHRRATERATDTVFEEKGMGFIEVIWLYLVAMKQKVCPTIEFGASHMQEDV